MNIIMEKSVCHSKIQDGNHFQDDHRIYISRRKCEWVLAVAKLSNRVVHDCIHAKNMSV